MHDPFASTAILICPDGTVRPETPVSPAGPPEHPLVLAERVKELESALASQRRLLVGLYNCITRKVTAIMDERDGISVVVEVSPHPGLPSGRIYKRGHREVIEMLAEIGMTPRDGREGD